MICLSSFKCFSFASFFFSFVLGIRASQVTLMIKNLPANAGDIEMQVPSLGWEDPLKEDMATHSSIFTWKIRGAWWATGHRVAKSQT